MFVINGKRILFILTSIFLALIIPVCALNYQNKNINTDNYSHINEHNNEILNNNFETSLVSTMAIPLTNKCVILDAGHGKPDEGAESPNGITESAINLKITMKLKKILEDAGVEVILTRSDEYGIYDPNSTTIKEQKISDLKNRVEIGNNSNADIFVSIHLNKINESKYYGWQTFYKNSNTNSQTLATCIQDKLNECIQRENHREAHSINDIYIVEHVKIPLTIVECGFLSNPEEEQLLQTDEYQNELALGIFLGIVSYFSTVI